MKISTICHLLTVSNGLVQDWGNSSALAMELPQSCAKPWYMDGLAQDCGISIANAPEISQSCAKPSIWGLVYKKHIFWTWISNHTQIILSYVITYPCQINAFAFNAWISNYIWHFSLGKNSLSMPNKPDFFFASKFSYTVGFSQLQIFNTHRRILHFGQYILRVLWNKFEQQIHGRKTELATNGIFHIWN